MNSQEITDIDFSPLNGLLSKNDMTKIKYISRYQLLNKLPQPTLRFISQHYFKLVWVSLAWTLLTIMNNNLIVKDFMLTGNLITIILLLVIHHANMQNKKGVNWLLFYYIQSIFNFSI